MLILAAALLAITAAATFALLELRQSLTVDVGAAGDGLVLRGFFPPERTPDGITFRWSEPDAALLLPDVLAPQALRIRLHADAERLGRPGGARMAIRAGSGPVTAVTLKPGWRVYQVLVSPGSGPGPRTQAITLRFSADQRGARALGVAVDSLATAPLGATQRASLLAALLTAWRLGLLLWTAKIVLATLQPSSRAARTAALMALGAATAGGIVFWVWRDPFALGAALELHPEMLLGGTLLLALVELAACHRRAAPPFASSSRP